jgi:predicted SAM-dependent methyltransferase
MEIDKLLKDKSGIRLDIGCGSNKQSDDFVGMDIRPLEGVDIVHDMTDIPWPLPDECVLTAIASHVVEHIPPHNFGFINWMDEVWRVLKPGGQLAIVVPHGNSQGYLQDPTHCNACNENTWSYFDPTHPLYSIYAPRPWRIEHLTWSPTVNIEVIMVKVVEDAE